MEADKPSPQQPGVAAPVMESGEDQGNRIIIVTAKREFACHLQSELTKSVEETCRDATGELVC